eukprot:TRINITY_DN12059_c0_g1_i1.p1 TRINITY_DN12059_c0_g1~~TRINITY_DN12059_c0_g1_i1.p1  ORF type:complete len:264 (+),score=68.68 TRINITY_DN12059_c0_g1_i1:243-1034(+)
MAAPSADPFPFVSQEIEDAIADINSRLEQWRRLVDTSPDVDAMISMRNSVERACASLDGSLKSVSRAIDTVAKDPARFRISADELVRRRAWLTRQQEAQKAFAGALADPGVQATFRRKQSAAVASVEKAKPASRTTGTTADGAGGRAESQLEDEAVRRNEDHLRGHFEQQQHLEQRQEEDIDSLRHTVGRIRHHATNIRTELSEQNAMLEQLSEAVASVQNKLRAAQRAVDHLVRQAGQKGALACIVGLVVALLILIVLTILL